MNSTARTIQKRKKTVEKILQDNPDARNDYRLLDILCWIEDGFLELSPEQIERFKKAPSPESYNRVSRLFQSKGDYLPTECHRIRRRRLSTNTRSEIKKIEIKKPIRTEFYVNSEGYEIAKEIYA